MVDAETVDIETVDAENVDAENVDAETVDTKSEPETTVKNKSIDYRIIIDKKNQRWVVLNNDKQLYYVRKEFSKKSNRSFRKINYGKQWCWEGENHIFVSPLKKYIKVGEKQNSNYYPGRYIESIDGEILGFVVRLDNDETTNLNFILNNKKLIIQDEYLKTWKWSDKFASQFELSTLKQLNNNYYHDDETGEILLAI